jgi:hypothetical protein
MIQSDDIHIRTYSFSIIIKSLKNSRNKILKCDWFAEILRKSIKNIKTLVHPKAMCIALNSIMDYIQ